MWVQVKVPLRGGSLGREKDRRLDLVMGQTLDPNLGRMLEHQRDPVSDAVTVLS